MSADRKSSPNTVARYLWYTCRPDGGSLQRSKMAGSALITSHRRTRPGEINRPLELSRVDVSNGSRGSLGYPPADKANPAFVGIFGSWSQAVNFKSLSRFST